MQVLPIAPSPTMTNFTGTGSEDIDIMMKNYYADKVETGSLTQ